MDWYFIMFIIVDLFLGLGMVYYMYSKKQTSGAITLFVLLIAVFAFFGLRWFNKDMTIKKPVSGDLLKTMDGSKYQWPPIINMCPDYFGIYTLNNTTPYCYDINNTYEMKYANVAGQRPIPGLNDGGQVYGYLASEVCSHMKETVDYYVRWEGVWDGVTGPFCPTPQGGESMACASAAPSSPASCMLF
jgi:hypothetical protein